MKRIRLIALATILSLSLAACHSSKKMSTIRRFGNDAKCELSIADVVLRSDTLHMVFPEVAMFDFNKSDLKPDANRSLQGLSRLLSKYRTINFMINGYTDNVGTEEVNQSLSERRAKNVEQLFLANGISSSRMQVQGLGAANPVATNTTEEGRQANRRVELVLFEQK